MARRRMDISGTEAKLHQLLERIADGNLLGATISLRAVGTQEPSVEFSEDLLIERCPPRGRLSDLIAKSFARISVRDHRSR